MTFLLDTRDPDPHPWTPFLPDGARLVRGTLETGDLALAALPEGAVIERKTVGDFLAAIGRERERFDREVRRSFSPAPWPPPRTSPSASSAGRSKRFSATPAPSPARNALRLVVDDENPR